MSDVLFKFYGSIVKMLLSRGYNSSYQKELIHTVLSDDQDEFERQLDKFENYEILNHRMIGNFDHSSYPLAGVLNNFEKLIGIWRKNDSRLSNQLDYRILLYFANVTDDSAPVNKQETVLAYSYLIRFKVKAMYFLHINPISTMSLKQLLSPVAPDGYIIKVFSAQSFNIDITKNFWVPKHILITNPEEFYATEGFPKGTLPKISKDDPAIVNLDAKPGDIIKIIRQEAFNGGFQILYFREVTSAIHPSSR